LNNLFIYLLIYFQRFALKILAADNIEMNANETGIMAELKHESLIVFYDKFYYENTNFCILMEFCEVYIFTFKNLIADFIMNCKREAI